MENLTHSLVGLASAKAGLERMSPYATIVCVASANAADADFVSLFFGDRWTLLEHHRGITHSIIGTIAIGFLIPILALAVERAVSAVSNLKPRIRFRGLLLASIIAAATHPLLDWTNNYGVRPFLPWSGRWFYGDLVFIVDPYIWLLLGGVGFLLTSNSKLKTCAWAVLGAAIITFIALAGWSSVADGASLRVAVAVWIVVVILLGLARKFGLQENAGPKTVIGALILLVAYWGALAFAHQLALSNTRAVADHLASRRLERVIQVVAMPMAASPLRWQSVAETDLAMYRFTVDVGGDRSGPSWTATVNGAELDRYEKPTGQPAEFVALAMKDRRAEALLRFARFPIEHVNADNCVGQALVQFADLRYTEPGRGRANFSVNIPVDCPSR